MSYRREDTDYPAAWLYDLTLITIMAFLGPSGH